MQPAVLKFFKTSAEELSNYAMGNTSVTLDNLQTGKCLIKCVKRFEIAHSVFIQNNKELSPNPTTADLINQFKNDATFIFEFLKDRLSGDEDHKGQAISVPIFMHTPARSLEGSMNIYDYYAGASVSQRGITSNDYVFMPVLQSHFSEFYINLHKYMTETPQADILSTTIRSWVETHIGNDKDIEKYKKNSGNPIPTVYHSTCHFSPHQTTLMFQKLTQQASIRNALEEYDIIEKKINQETLALTSSYCI